MCIRDRFRSLPDEALFITKIIFYVLLFIGYWAFTGIALYRNFSDGLILLVLGVVVLGTVGKIANFHIG